MPHLTAGPLPLRTLMAGSAARSRAPESDSYRVQATRPPAIRLDRLDMSGPGRTLAGLVQVWGTLGRVFGFGTQPGGPQGPDLHALRQTLIDARATLDKMQQKQGVINSLKSSVLRQAEGVVERAYGLQADGAPLKVVFEDDMGDALASVNYRYDRNGRAVDQELHLNLSQFTPDSRSNGINGHVIENDRIIAHELTHAVMGRTMNVRALPTWFMEGTAEYVAGGAERTAMVLKRVSPQQLVSRVTRPWEGDNSQYAASYAAVRYLDHATQQGGGIKGIMAHLKEGATLDGAIATVSGGEFQGVSAFLDRLVSQGEGARFLRTVDLSGRDPGAVSGASSGPAVVPDPNSRGNQPMRGFQVQWPNVAEGLRPMPSEPWFGPLAPAGVAAAYRRWSDSSEV